MSQLALSLFPGPATLAQAETCLVPVPEDERPLRGDAGWIDWRLCGRISEQLRSGYVSGMPGEAALLPGGVPLHISRILLVGVGPSALLAGGPLANAMRGAVSKLLALQCGAALLACPGSIDLQSEAASLLSGVVQGLSEAPEDSRLNIVLADGQQCEKALLSALASVVPDAHGCGVSIELSWVGTAEDPEPVLQQA
ncbi:MAG: hypothetical protein GY725_03725 [bacterium]|nr:hypothetical protein [bacterium]